MKQYVLAQMLIISLLTSTAPCIAAETNFTIIARYKLEEITNVTRADEHIVNGIIQTCKAPDGMHFELIRIRGAISKEVGETVNSVTVYPALLTDDTTVPCVATIDEFGEVYNFRRVKPMLRVSNPSRSETSSVEDLNAIYMVSNNASSLRLKISDDLSLRLPELSKENIPSSQIQGNFNLIKAELHDELTTNYRISGLDMATPNIWKPISGKFLVLEIQPKLSNEIPAHIKVVTLKPQHFAIKLPSGSLLKPVGALTPDAISEQRYPMNKGRMNDGTWGDLSTFKLVFVVPSNFTIKKGMEILFLPALQQ